MMLEGEKRVNPATWAQTSNALLGSAMLQREHGGQKETDLVEPRLCHRKTEPLDVGLGFVDRSSRSAYAVADGEVVSGHSV